MAFLVSFGVLLDTLLVRSLPVPALTIHIGPGFGWPGRASGRGTAVSGAAPRG
ncbi:hypothetical protein AB0I91_22485 [Actinosynnema sp. NPDC049800]